MIHQIKLPDMDGYLYPVCGGYKGSVNLESF
jgi:hypothetical protein